MKTKVFLIVAIVIASLSFSQAQDYKTAIGLRLGSPLSVSYKTFISNNHAIELTAGLRSYDFYSWFNVGGYYQVHNEIASVNGLQWYYGGGANVYFWSYDKTYYPNNDFSSLSVGISGCLGLDYKFSDIPLNLSVDWIPTYFLNGFGSGFGASYGALSARYVIK